MSPSMNKFRNGYNRASRNWPAAILESLNSLSRSAKKARLQT
jgi:hypothetical protein